MAKQVDISKLTKRFRLGLEESWYHERPEVRNPDKRWYVIVPCKGFKPSPMQEGPFISLYSEDPPTLHLYTDRVQLAKIIWGEIKKTPGTRAEFHQNGEAVLYFPPELLELAAELAGARKRRQLSEEHRAKLVEAGKVGREALKKWQKERSKGDKTDPNSNDLPEVMVYYPSASIEAGKRIKIEAR
jgi:hypothetical protein